MRFRRPATLVAAAVLTLTTALAGCGSMLTPEQRAAVSGNGGYGASGGNGGGAAGPDAAGGPGQAAGPGAAGGPAGAGPGGGSAAAGPGSPGGAKGPGIGGGGCKPGAASDKGVTPNSIAIGNASDISGVVPSLFQGAQDATKAFAAYANANGGICGRTLDVHAYDTGETNSGDKAAAQKGCGETFAMVGSMSAWDNGGASDTSGCGEPDVRGMSQTKDRANAPTSFGAHSYNPGYYSTAGADYFGHKYPDGVKKAALLYINQGAVQSEVDAETKVDQSRGWNFIYTQPIDVSDVNYSPYVLQMQNKGVQVVIFIGVAQHGVRMAKAMQQQGYKPQAFIVDQAIYGDEYVSSGGSAVDGTYSEIQSLPLEELNSTPEGQLYVQWLQRVKPGAKPTMDGLVAWSAARLFATELVKLGPNPTRQGLLAALAGVHDWNGAGLTAPMDVAGRKTPPCSMFVQVRGPRWTRDGPASGYACGSLAGV